MSLALHGDARSGRQLAFVLSVGSHHEVRRAGRGRGKEGVGGGEGGRRVFGQRRRAAGRQGREGGREGGWQRGVLLRSNLLSPKLPGGGERGGVAFNIHRE